MDAVKAILGVLGVAGVAIAIAVTAYYGLSADISWYMRVCIMLTAWLALGKFVGEWKKAK